MCDGEGPLCFHLSASQNNAAVSHKEKPGRTYDHQDDFHYSLGIPIPWVRPSHVARFRHNSIAVATQ